MTILDNDNICGLVGVHKVEAKLDRKQGSTSIICICSALFGNLRNFEIALRILSIAKLRANFEIADAILKLCNETTAQFRNRARYTSTG